MPILGHGDIASVLKDRKDRLYFASGVSNSQETDENKYQRETDLLLSQDKTAHIVYFSSLAVFSSNTRYAQHKRRMEAIVKHHFSKHTIVRIGNITWGTNPHTLINYFKAEVKAGNEIEIRDEYKFIIDKKEFLYWIDMIPMWSCEMSITGRRLTVQGVFNEYVIPHFRKV